VLLLGVATALRQLLSPFLLHSLNPHALSSGAGEVVDAEGEADPEHTYSGEWTPIPIIVSIALLRRLVGRQRTMGCHAAMLSHVALSAQTPSC
jgi:hypothetical protein